VRLNGALRSMLVPFALTLLVGGVLIVVAFALTGLLPLPAVAGLVARPAPREAIVEAENTGNAVPQPVNASPPTASATATRAPRIDDFTLVCAANAHRLALAHPDGSLATTASRLLVPPESADAYVLADGRLARVPLEALDQPTDVFVMVQTEPLDRLVNNVPFQELVDLAYDRSSGTLLALDKSGRVFRYTPGGQWGLVRYPEMAPDGEADPGYLAISAAGGSVYLLDADLNQVWRFPIEGADNGPPAPVFPGSRFDGAFGGPGLEAGVDLLTDREGLVALYTDGTIGRYDGGESAPRLELAVEADLPLSLVAHEGQAYVVDGLRRAFILADTDTSKPQTGYQFVFPEMGLVRDAAFDEAGRVLALADSTLLVHAPGESDEACDPPDDLTAPSFYYGADLTDVLADFRYPIDNALLPSVPRAYPGARRLYRAGVHRGLDIHPWDVPGGIDIGEPIHAMQDGVVTRADVNYTPVSEAEFAILTEQALALNISLPSTLDRIGGRQVAIDHGNGVTTRYMHLDSLGDGIALGAEVKRGQVIGTVGVSGTGREGSVNYAYVAAHAHVEIWIGDHYLGQGLTLRETMWLLQQVFPAVDVAPPLF